MNNLSRNDNDAERWVRWEPPIQGLSDRYYSESIVDDASGLRIILSEANEDEKRVQILFVKQIFSYRRTEESSAVKRLYTLLDHYDRDFIMDWAFFKILNSQYSQFVANQSLGKVKAESLTHFVLFSIDFVVDVISMFEPQVEWLTK